MILLIEFFTMPQDFACMLWVLTMTLGGSDIEYYYQ